MKNNFAQNVKELRIQKGLKQLDVAKALYTTQRKVSYWETGKIEPDIDTLWALAEFYDITVDELIGKDI